jgi:hypothetical protein
MAEITYFEKAGSENTERTLEIAKARFLQGGIDAIVLASSYGETARKAVEMFKDCDVSLLVVGEVLDGKQSPDAPVQEELRSRGHRVIWGTTLGGMTTFSREPAAGLVADAYRRVSEGFKVVCEITLIAGSQGYLETGQKVIAIAGTHRGSDTAVVASAASFTAFKKFEVNEILCKPYQRAND